MMGPFAGRSRARYPNSYWNRGDLGAARLRRTARHHDSLRRRDRSMPRGLVDTLRGLGVGDQAMALTADHGEEFPTMAAATIPLRESLKSWCGSLCYCAP
jgi:hypothetical protein